MNPFQQCSNCLLPDNKGEEVMSFQMTMRHIQAIAVKRGYHLMRGGTYLRVVKKNDAESRCSFDLSDPFTLDPLYTQQLALTCIYYWIRGYDFTYGENRKVLLRRNKCHPFFDSSKPHERLFDYQTMWRLQSEMVWWILYIEIHHCPYLETPLREQSVLYDDPTSGA